MAWYDKSYRRHLCDMHINDWGDGRFLSKFSPENYYLNLKKANVKSAMVYFQSHIGYCYYPTKVGHMHSAFNNRPDTMKKLVDLCHGGNIDVVAYYSINYNAIESNFHPEWAVKQSVDGEKLMFSGDRYEICCPNNSDYMNFVLAQLQEILEYTDVDGLFLDMPFWKDPCYCDACREKYKNLYGTDIPSSRDDPEWNTFTKAREIWTDEYTGVITDFVHSIRPDVTVYYNYAFAALNAVEFIGSEVINEHQDYASGDLYDGFLTQSFACKLYGAVTKNKPFEFMTGRCDPSLTCHTITKSFDKLRLAVMLTAAHHGANLVIDAIDPVGTMDSRFYTLLGRLYKEVEQYEPYMESKNAVADIGLFYIMEGRTMGTPTESSHYKSTLNTAKTLIVNHIPFDVITNSTVSARLDNYKAVILANPNGLSKSSIKIITEYVANGGIVYFSGSDQPELISELLQGSVLGKTYSSNTYIAPKKEFERIFEDYNECYPLSFQTDLPILKIPDDATVMADIKLPYKHPSDPNIYSSIHSNPPGTLTDYPAVVCKKIGKGNVIWSAAGIESKNVLCYQKILQNLLDFAGLKEYSLKTSATRHTELVAFKDDDRILISAVYISDDETTEPQRPFEISVKCEKKPSLVTLIRTGKHLDFSYENGWINITSEELNIFDMYEIKL